MIKVNLFEPLKISNYFDIYATLFNRLDFKKVYKL
jgi:hypothetical protein